MGGSSYPRAVGRNWYTKLDERDGTVHLQLNKAGDITTSYPHLHVIFDREEEIRIVVSYGPHRHGRILVLPGDTPGNDVNAAIERMLREL